MPKREVTAVALAPDGAIYAAAVGNRQAAHPLPRRSSASAASAPAPPGRSRERRGRAAAGGNRRPPPPSAPRRRGGRQRGVPHRCRRRAAAHVEPCAGRGVRDRVRRERARAARARAIRATSTGSNRRRCTRRCWRCRPRRLRRSRRASDGQLYAATGNTGKVYEIGPGLEREGSIESDVFDAGDVLAVGTAELRRRI